MKALIGFKAFYFFGLVLVRFRCICKMALSLAGRGVKVVERAINYYETEFAVF